MIAVLYYRRRLFVILTVAMCAAVIGGIARTAMLPDQATSPLPPNSWHCIESSTGAAAIRIPAASGTHTLVIGCLAAASETYQVRLRFVDEATELSRVSLMNDAGVVRGFGAPPNEMDAYETTARGPRAPQKTTREFYLHVTDGELNDPQQYARMTTQCVAEGDRVRVFVDQQLGANGIRESQIADLIHLLESDVLPRVEAQFGLILDVDHDRRFAIVISPWLGKLQGGNVSINGMVRSSDFQRDVAPPLGNQCDMLMLNSSLPCGAALRDLLSHEVAHAACISQRMRTSKMNPRDEQDWVNEGLAHLAEPTLTNSSERIATFLDDPSQHPLVIPDYYRAGLWRDPGCRGATVLFSKWCVERHGQGLCRRLAQASESGCCSFEQATAERFENLFRQWSVSLADENGRQPDELTCQANILHAAKARRQHPAVGHSEVAITIRGTAFTVVELPTTNASSVMLQIDGDSAAHWQYSIRRSAASTPTVESKGRLLSADRSSI
ncbi:MAG: hypothetical protein NT013_22105 [Planctomycetia bacterium]|nr:hypothetical protein [Planctomycetia bacterium]